MSAAAPYYRKRRALDDVFTDVGFSYLLQQRVNHPSLRQGDEIYTTRWDNWHFPPWKEYVFAGSYSATASGGDVTSLVVSTSGVGYRGPATSPWVMGPGGLATGMQVARNAQSKLGPKVFDWSFEGTRTTTINGGTPVEEDSVDGLSGVMADNADEWLWTWVSCPVILDPQPAPTLTTAWDVWEELTITGSGTVTEGGITATWTASFVIALTAI